MRSLNKLRLIGLIRVAYVMVITIMIFRNINIVFADYQDLEVPTQVNKKTNYLYESDGNPDQLMKEHSHSLDDMKGIIGDKDGNTAIGFVSEASGVDSNKARSKSSDLQGIGIDNVASRGRSEMAKNNTMNELYVNWEKDPHRQDLKEAKDIGNAQDSLLNNLLGKLRELNINCKYMAGNVEKEPEFYLKVREKQTKDTKYNQHFCEHRLNKYNCNYKRYVKCEKHNQSMRWYKWQRTQTRRFNGESICRHHGHWLEDVFWKKDKRKHKKYHLQIRGDGGTSNDIANSISREKGKKPGHVRVVGINRGGEGGLWGTNCRGLNHRFIAGTYTVSYQYRDGDPICLRWTEEWRDECLLEDEVFLSPGKRVGS